MVAELESDSLEWTVAAGTELVAAGPVRPSIYFIVSGRIDVVTTAAGSDTVLARLDPGKVVGGMSAFTGETAIATAQGAEAGRRVRLLRLKLVDRLPESRALPRHLARTRMRTHQERLARTNLGYAEQLRAAETPLTDRRFRWSVQLNLNNLLDQRELVVNNVHPRTLAPITYRY